jgi:hypothetical protein
LKPTPTGEVALVILALSLVSAVVTWQVAARGWTLYYGDAEAHLDIARRVVDSRTAGYDQFGTVWLPLPHALMLPLVRNDRLWRSGLAGAIPSSICFVLSGAFLFAAARRAFHSTSAAIATTGLFALNPNLLYLQATPMTEPVFLLGLLALLYFTIRFHQTRAMSAVWCAALAGLIASLTRYEGWFLIPFAALFFLIVGGWRPALLFAVIAALAPAYWLAHNAWYFGDPLAFYNGPYSAKAIQGAANYPGQHDWSKAWLYYRTAARLCAGWPLIALASIGAIAALWKRAWWPLALLIAPPFFYLWSIHSSGTPIFVPELWPGTYYNARYGLTALPILAFCAGAITLLLPQRVRVWAAAIVICLIAVTWTGDVICWKESRVNSETRRAWTTETAATLKSLYRPGAGVFTMLGDLAGVYRKAGIPLRETLNEADGPAWNAALANPRWFLHEEWAVAAEGDDVWRTVRKSGHYFVVAAIRVSGARPIEIYRRN